MDVDRQLIKKYILVLTVTVLLAFMGVYLWFYKSTEHIIVETFTDKTSVQTELVTSLIYQRMDQVFSDIDMLANLPMVNQVSDQVTHYMSVQNTQMMRPSQSVGDERQLYDYFKLYAEQHEGIKNVYLATNTGGYLVWPETSVVPKYDPRVRPWYEKGLEGNGKVLQTEPYIDLSTNKLIISNVRSFKDPSGKVRGVVGIDASLSQLNELSSYFKVSKHDRLIIVHNSGLILYDSEKNHDLVQNLKAAEPALKSHLDSSEVYEVNLHDQRYYGKTSPLTRLNWKIIMLSERDNLMAKTNLVIQNYIMGAFISVVVVLIILLGGSYLLFYNRFLQKLVRHRTADLQEIIDTLILKEETIRKSEERYSTLVDNIPGVVFRCAAQSPWSMQTITSGVLDLTGYPPEDFLGDTPLTNWGKMIHPDDDTEVNRILDPSVKRDYEIEYRICQRSGMVRWVYERGSMISVEDGIDFIDGIIFDITERKEAEAEVKRLYAEMEVRVVERTQDLKNAMNQLVEQEKMASLGGIVSGVAHEINTPLGICITASSYLKNVQTELVERFETGQLSKGKLVELTHTSHESIDLLQTNLKKAAELVNTFKMISVNQITEEMIHFNLEEYLQTILMTLNYEYKNKKYEFDINCDSNINIYSYPGAYSQIFTILLLNSFVHGFIEGEGGKVSIEAHILEGRNRLRICYADTGVGIPDEAVPRIFEPFFTAHDTKNGSGLGLYILYNIVTQKLGGHVKCESRVGFGTKFVIELPYSAELNQ